ncbi:uncharacterized protein LOC142089918 [Calonectris borealis]|uniref:uncharacterized protein LOC142089918 n=1 Tax=Calonectris borealis TaxID=1323832 RepID=UPI003F4C2EDD
MDQAVSELVDSKRFWIAMLRGDVQIKAHDEDEEGSVTTESMEKDDGPLETLPCCPVVHCDATTDYTEDILTSEASDEEKSASERQIIWQRREQLSPPGWLFRSRWGRQAGLSGHPGNPRAELRQAQKPWKTVTAQKLRAEPPLAGVSGWREFPPKSIEENWTLGNRTSDVCNDVWAVTAVPLPCNSAATQTLGWALHRCRAKEVSGSQGAHWCSPSHDCMRQTVVSVTAGRRHPSHSQRKSTLGIKDKSCRKNQDYDVALNLSLPRTQWLPLKPFVDGGGTPDSTQCFEEQEEKHTAYAHLGSQEAWGSVSQQLLG